MRRTAVLEAVVRAVGRWMGRRSPAWSAGSGGGGAVAVVELGAPARLCLGLWRAALVCAGSAADLGGGLLSGLLEKCPQPSARGGCCSCMHFFVAVVGMMENLRAYTLHLQLWSTVSGVSDDHGPELP